MITEYVNVAVCRKRQRFEFKKLFEVRIFTVRQSKVFCGAIFSMLSLKNIGSSSIA